MNTKTKPKTRSQIRKFQKNLKSMRLVRHMTLDGLGKKAGISKGYMWEVENSLNVNPTLSVLLCLSKAMGVGLDELMGE